MQGEGLYFLPHTPSLKFTELLFRKARPLQAFVGLVGGLEGTGRWVKCHKGQCGLCRVKLEEKGVRPGDRPAEGVHQ